MRCGPHSGVLLSRRIARLLAVGHDRLVIGAVHAIVFSEDADAARAFFRDVLELPCVDAGGGWLIFALPPAELALHPTSPDDSGRHELYLMCDDVERTKAELEAKGVEFLAPVSDEGWGRLTRLRIPGGGEMGLYEPRHPSPLPAFADAGKTNNS
jgi:catechol 2,3-dioxygenase-like lactoylglutathione lyase family enzyme